MTSRMAAATGRARIAPSSPASDPPMTIANMTSGGVELDGVALDLRDEHVVLDLLDDQVQDERRDDRLDAGGRREQHGRDGRDDRPDDRQQLEDAGRDRQQDRVPAEDRVDGRAQDEQPDEREHADRRRRGSAAPGPIGRSSASDDAEDGPDVEPPCRRQAPVELPRQRDAVLEEVEDPDGQDHVGEQTRRRCSSRR